MPVSYVSYLISIFLLLPVVFITPILLQHFCNLILDTYIFLKFRFLPFCNIFTTISLFKRCYYILINKKYCFKKQWIKGQRWPGMMLLLYFSNLNISYFQCVFDFHNILLLCLYRRKSAHWCNVIFYIIVYKIIT